MSKANSDQNNLITNTISMTDLSQVEDQPNRLVTSLCDLAASLNNDLSIRQALAKTLDLLPNVIGFDSASFLLVEDKYLVLVEAKGAAAKVLGRRTPLSGDNVAARILHQKQPLLVTDVKKQPDRVIQHDANLRSWLAAPLVRGPEVIGLLVVEAFNPAAYTIHDARILEAFANQAALAVSNARFRDLALAKTNNIGEDQFLHALQDSIRQSLYSLTLLTSGWGTMARQDQLTAKQAAAHFQQLEEISQLALNEMRILTYLLQPSRLREKGLITALEDRLDVVERMGGIAVSLVAEGVFDSLPKTIEEALFHIILDLLNQTASLHSSTKIDILLRITEDQLTFSMMDDGLRPNTPADQSRQTALQAQVDALGAQMSISTNPDEKNTTIIIVPLN